MSKIDLSILSEEQLIKLQIAIDHQLTIGVGSQTPIVNEISTIEGELLKMAIGEIEKHNLNPKYKTGMTLLNCMREVVGLSLHTKTQSNKHSR